MARNIGASTKNEHNLTENRKNICEKPQKNPRNPFGFERKFAKINNRNVSYFSLGNGEKNIVFLHGWGSDASAFFFVAKQLCAKYRVVAIDFLGFGQSDYPPDFYGVKEYAADVASLLDVLHIKAATFVGHSFGGRVAIELAVYYPQIAKRIVLVDSAGIKPKRKPSYYFKVFAHKILKKLGKRGLKGSSDYNALCDEMKKVFVRVVNYNQKRILNKIDVPCAIFWGKDDKETPFYMYKCFLKNIDEAQGFLLNGGHFAFVEDKVTFGLILSAFLEETDETI